MTRWKLGSVLGIGIYVHWTFLLLPLFVFWSTLESAGREQAAFAVILTLAVFGCVILHELGHALAARRCGIGTRDITLYPIGGVARLERMSERPWEEFFIALAGPAVNVVLVLLLLLLVGPAMMVAGPEIFLRSLLGRFLLFLLLSNGMLVVFNLLPAFPMDGGRVLRALLSLKLGQLRSTEIAARIGVVLAFLMIAGGIYVALQNPWNISMVLVGGFVLFAGQQELAAVRYRQARRDEEPLDVLPVYEELSPAEPGPGSAAYSGLAWDVSRRAWVIWHNGRAISIFGAKPE